MDDFRLRRMLPNIHRNKMFSFTIDLPRCRPIDENRYNETGIEQKKKGTSLTASVNCVQKCQLVPNFASIDVSSRLFNK